MKPKTLKASIAILVMLAAWGTSAEEARKPGTVVWVLTVTTATPGRYVEPDAVVSTDWTAESDCNQAEKLEKEIARLAKRSVITTCRKAEILNVHSYSK